MKKAISKWSKKNIKRILIALGFWSFIKKLAGKEHPGLLNNELREEGLIFYSEFLSKNDLVFDVGANYGNRVAIFLEMGCRVTAVEPQQRCIQYLNKHYGARIKIEEVGLGAAPDFKIFYEADNSVLSTFSDSYINKVKNKRHSTTFWKPSNKIKIITLDELIKKYGNPAFIKIDVEGYEFEVLKGLSHHTGIISFEYTVPELTSDLLNCVKRLHDIGYNSFNYSVGESMRFNNNWLGFDDFVNLVNKKEFISTRFGDVYVKLIQQ
jgi:FkbM family methyltransferase